MTSTNRGERPGPVYDRAMRGLLAGALVPVCASLGISVPPQARAVAETFPGTTSTADLVLDDGAGRIIHLECERRGDRSMVARMLKYRSAIMVRHPRHAVDQYVVVLGRGRVGEVPGWAWQLPFTTIYLRELSPELFLADVTTAPLAALTGKAALHRRASLVEAVRLIGAEGGSRSSELLDHALVLAAIGLKRTTIVETVQEVAMSIESILDIYRETTLGQVMHEEGREEGREDYLVVILTNRFGDDPRVAAVAAGLAKLAPAEGLRSIASAATLDDLL